MKFNCEIKKELERIKSTQNRYQAKPFRTKPIEFPEWFLNGLRRYEARGAEFELIESGMVKICWPGKVPMLRTVEDFKREYQRDYLKEETTVL